MKTRYLFIGMLCALSISLACAQQQVFLPATNSVLANGGSVVDNFNADNATYSMQYTIGELFTFSGVGNTVVVSSGFNQGHVPFVVGQTERIVPDVEVTLFPNPARDYVMVKITGNSGMLNPGFVIRDLIGREVFTGIISYGPADEYRINTHTLISGFYLLEVRHENQKVVKSFVVQ